MQSQPLYATTNATKKSEKTTIAQKSPTRFKGQQNEDLAVDDSFDTGSFNPVLMLQEMREFRIAQRKQQKNISSRDLNTLTKTPPDTQYMLSSREGLDEVDRQLNRLQADGVSISRRHRSQIDKLIQQRSKMKNQQKKPDGKRILNPWQFSFSINSRKVEDGQQAMHIYSKGPNQIIEETASTVIKDDDNYTIERKKEESQQNTLDFQHNKDSTLKVQKNSITEEHPTQIVSSTDEFTSGHSGRGILTNKDIAELYNTFDYVDKSHSNQSRVLGRVPNIVQPQPQPLKQAR